MDLVNFKVILIYPDDTREARRFGMVQTISTRMELFQEKLHSLFPNLRHKQYRIFWQDDESDNVVIDDDEGLEAALISQPSPLKKLYVDCKQNKWSDATPGEIHHHITCDGCKIRVMGFRYKCLQCPDYDLCEKCESMRLHSSHMMLRLPKELPRMSFYKCWLKICESVDQMVKSMDSSRHSGRDHSEKCGRRCGGKHRRSYNFGGMESDECHEGKDKHEYGQARAQCEVEKYNESRSFPLRLLLPETHLTVSSGSGNGQETRRVCSGLEDVIGTTVKLFVSAMKDGFTPKSKSEKACERNAQQDVPSDSKQEKPRDDEQRRKENEMKDEEKRKKESEMKDEEKRKKESEMKDEEKRKKESEMKDEEKENENEAKDEEKPKMSYQLLSEMCRAVSETPSSSAEKVEKKPEAESNTTKKDTPLDPKIEDALRGMLAMGFSNDGGTLLKILEEMDGDILKVLECIDSSLL